MLRGPGLPAASIAATDAPVLLAGHGPVRRPVAPDAARAPTMTKLPTPPTSRRRVRWGAGSAVIQLGSS